MKSKDKVLIFKEEILKIKDKKIKKFTAVAVSKLPDYFFTVAASSSGKYHPSYCLGKGGLIRHTKAAVKIALELFNNETVQIFSNIEKDIIISSIILHDGVKHGLNGSHYTIATHPKLICEYIANDEELTKLLNENDLNSILSNMWTHMGQWNYDYKTKKVVLDKPETDMQKFVHLCDYLASRKCIEVKL